MNNKQLKLLKDYVLKNGGATLKNNGAFMDLAAGFMVSLADTEKKISLSSLKLKDLNNYLKLAKNKNAFVGLWLDNNILYLDLSVNIINKNEALKVAKNNSQLAIYDIANQATIYL